jgi:diguanylate cyclase (GGDEF)-like protein
MIFCYIDISQNKLQYSSIVIILSSFITYNFFVYFFSRKVHLQSRLKFRELIKEQKYIVVLNKEIHKRAELEKKLTELACIDYLTEVSNRRYFMDIAEHEFEKIKRTKEPLSIILLDIDNFKTINDTYGHSVGDLAIKKLVEISQKSLRKTDFIGRIGGEEFAVLCINSTKVETYEVAKRLCKTIEDDSKKFEYHFTVSIGVSEIKPDHPNIDKAMHLADLALYEAKRTGKNKVVSA